MFNIANMVNVLNIFNHQWLPSLKKLINLASSLSQLSNLKNTLNPDSPNGAARQASRSEPQPSSRPGGFSPLRYPGKTWLNDSQEMIPLNLNNLGLGEWANWLNNSSFPFAQSLAPKIANPLRNSFRTTILGLLPSLFLGFSGFLI